MIIDTGKMKIHDISMTVSHSMPVYKGKESKRPILIVESDHSTGVVYESRLEFNLHTGTHLDAPLHMIAGGSTINTLNLSRIVTECKVYDLIGVRDKITREDLLGLSIEEGNFLLLKTRNSYEELLEKEFIYLDESGAKYLAERKIKGVGIDSLGIERNQPGHGTHIRLFEAGITILEGLCLKDIDEGEYLLSAAPVLIEGAEAAPVRAYLLR